MEKTDGGLVLSLLCPCRYVFRGLVLCCCGASETNEDKTTQTDAPDTLSFLNQEELKAFVSNMSKGSEWLMSPKKDTETTPSI